MFRAKQLVNLTNEISYAGIDRRIKANCIDETVPLHSVLNQAAIIASAIKDNKFKSWLNRELNGEGWDFESLPPYGLVKGQITEKDACEYWTPVSFETAELATEASIYFFKESIGRLEAELKGLGGKMLCVSLMPEQLRHIAQVIYRQDIPNIFRAFSGPSIQEVLNQVRHRVEEWLYSLPKAKISLSGSIKNHFKSIVVATGLMALRVAHIEKNVRCISQAL